MDNRWKIICTPCTIEQTKRFLASGNPSFIVENFCLEKRFWLGMRSPIIRLLIRTFSRKMSIAKNIWKWLKSILLMRLVKHISRGGSSPYCSTIVFIIWNQLFMKELFQDFFYLRLFYGDICQIGFAQIIQKHTWSLKSDTWN